MKAIPNLNSTNRHRTYINGRIVQQQRLEDGIVESMDCDPQDPQLVDEEREAMRTETIRFF